MDRRKAIKNTGAVTGGAILFPSLAALLHSCKADSRLDWEPQFFTHDEANFVSALVDTILPKTDTPGALDVKVDLFLDKVIDRTYDEEGQKKMRSQIASFNEKCKQEHGDDFANLSQANKEKVLTEEEARGGKFSGGVWGTAVGKQEPISFYRSMKSMAIWAYLSSEEIGKNVLSYDPIPGVYNGCIEAASIGNKWSL